MNNIYCNCKINMERRLNMNVKSNLKRVLLGMMVTNAIGSSVQIANTACAVFQCQSEESEKIKKLRKL